MTIYQKESRKAGLLNLLDGLKLALSNFRVSYWTEHAPLNLELHGVIDRNLTSIEKQLRRL